ncbi:acetyltransferase [Butyricimonas virosa]|jgi:sugar O-acyltransferase (sialic acid O-acetyltransferase NeuD family)|nr:acetyltransferase [Butyricimonas virosa]
MEIIEMKEIAVYGAGGLGRETVCLLQKINSQQKNWDFIGFFDDGQPVGTLNEYGRVLGGICELNAWKKELNVIIAIGNPHSLMQVSRKITNPLIMFPNIIYGFSCADEDNFSIGKGNIIGGSTYFSCNVSIGDFNILNGSVQLGHDVTLGSYNVLMPGVRISGETTIGDGNLFGVNSIVLQQLKIGSGVRLGAGSVLMHKPKANSLYIGNPAKIFKY